MNRGPERIFDEYLVVMSQGGSREALAVLAGRWSPRLQRYCSRLLRSPDWAEDVVQDIWAAALKGLPRLSDSAAFPTWIYAIATRKCADVVRGRVRSRRVAHSVATQQSVHVPAELVGVEPELSLDLAAAILRLPLEQRLTVSLHYGEDLGVEEIAAVLNIPAGTVKSRLHHARDALRTLMEGDIP